MSEERGSAEAEPTSRTIFVEAFGTYAIAFFSVLVFALASIWVGLVAEFLYALVALAFFIVPQKVMERRGLEPEDYGMAAPRPLRNVGWGLLASLVTFPFFLGGYWVWETQIRERDFEFDAGHYRQWSVDLQGEPNEWGREKHGVWVWADDDLLKLGLRNRDLANNEVVVEANEAFEPAVRGVNAKPLSEDGRTWSFALTSSRGRGVVTIEGVDSLAVEVSPVAEGREQWPLYTGPKGELSDGMRIDFDRSLWWLLLWLATQILLIALPEEYFYRGYLQTRLGKALDKRRAERGLPTRRPEFLGINAEVVLTSLLFGIGHLLIPVGGAILGNRFAVFFPSLLFGALRRKTGTITAPVVYHAASNMMVLVAAVHFG